MLALDASVAVAAVVTPGAFSPLGDEELVAPALMWSEARSTLRLREWNGQLGSEDALAALERLEAGPVSRRQPGRLGHETWRVAHEMGWARTYDAEYVALARLLGCRLVTLDARLRRGANRLGLVVSPAEL